MQVRKAEPRDAATIHRFIVELAEYEKEPDAVEVTPVRLAAQLEASPPPFECFLVEEALTDGAAPAPVGFALFFHTYSTWRGRRGIHLEDLYVTPAARGRGLGRALFERVAAATVERGCARLELAVLDWNEPAIGFYRALGARPMAGWTTWRLDGAALKEVGATAAS